MKNIHYKILLIIQLAIICWLIPQAYYAVDSFNWNYTEELKERTKPVEVEFTTEIFELSAYNTLKSQTDENECEASSGVDICNLNFKTIACPSRFSFGTTFGINGEKYVCLDRLAERYRDKNFLDINFDKDIEGALEFGRKYNVEVKIYNYEPIRTNK